MYVMGGSRTGDEMTHAWIAITHLDDEGYDSLVAEREAKEARSMASAND
jgi:glutamate/tyrosine decarboxylase-like PLP-dependent enzyme